LKTGEVGEKKKQIPDIIVGETETCVSGKILFTCCLPWRHHKRATVSAKKKKSLGSKEKKLRLKWVIKTGLVASVRKQLCSSESQTQMPEIWRGFSGREEDHIQNGKGRKLYHLTANNTALSAVLFRERRRGWSVTGGEGGGRLKGMG